MKKTLTRDYTEWNDHIELNGTFFSVTPGE